MNSLKLNDWVQILGTIAIVVSLIFVGLQLRQTHSIAIANQYQERTGFNISYQLAALQSDSVLAFHGANRKQQFLQSDFSDELKEQVKAFPDEFAGFLSVSTAYSFFVFDNNHFQYQAGYLAEPSWQTYRTELKGYLESENYLFVWDRIGYTFRPEFRALVERLIAENAAQSSK